MTIRQLEGFSEEDFKRDWTPCEDLQRQHDVEPDPRKRSELKPWLEYCPKMPVDLVARRKARMTYSESAQAD